VVLEGRGVVPVGVGQGDPELGAVQDARMRPRGLLGVRDGASGGHQAQLAWTYGPHAAEAVAVQHFAGVEPADGLQAHVRVRRHLHAGLVGDVVGAVVVDEAPCAHHAAAEVGQQAPHDGALAERHDAAGEQLVDRLRRHVLAAAADGRRGLHVKIAHTPDGTPTVGQRPYEVAV
jgi:hypothetical protein